MTATTSRVRVARRRVVVVTLVLVGVLAIAALAAATSQSRQLLDPTGRGPDGGAALAQTLRAHGVAIQVVRSADALAGVRPGPGTTVVVADPEFLGPTAAGRLRDAAATADRLVLVSPSTDQLSALGMPLTAVPTPYPGPVSSGCTNAVSGPHDSVADIDTVFVTEAGGAASARLCFALPDPHAPAAPAPRDAGFGAAMATVPGADGHPEVVALGMSEAFTNRRITSQAHAGVAIRALGRSPRLVWYQPGVDDLFGPDGAAPSTTDPWPSWLAPAAMILAFAVVVFALVRGRRLGPLATEPLPVFVRAVETTESRGRIYRRARDRARAAAILRSATTGRLARRLAVPPTDLAGLVVAVAAASGHPPADVAATLTGPAPTTDVELRTLARSLSQLEERVRTS